MQKIAPKIDQKYNSYPQIRQNEKNKNPEKLTEHNRGEALDKNTQMGPKMQNLFQNIAKFIEKKCAKRAETIRKKFTRNGDQKIHTESISQKSEDY